MGKTTFFIAGDFCSKPSTSFIMVSDDLRNLIQSSDIKVVNFEVPHEILQRVRTLPDTKLVKYV